MSKRLDWPTPHYDFKAIFSHEIAGQDYRIEHRHGKTGVAIIAPHGGMIERGTTPLADAIARQDHSYYSFIGIKPTLKENKILHVSSNRFDEPIAQNIVNAAQKVITIHGAKGNEQAVYAGGLDLELRTIILQALNRAGFIAEDDPSPTRQGKKPSNICNQGNTGKGLQLELTYGLRKAMFAPANDEGNRLPTDFFYKFVEAIRSVLIDFN